MRIEKNIDYDDLTQSPAEQFSNKVLQKDS